MPKINLNDKELNILIPRYKSVVTRISELAFEINQMINRLEPNLMTADDIDIRLTSMLRNLQNCEEYITALILQINVAVERFGISDKKLTGEANELIYEFKQILHQIKKNSVHVLPNQTTLKNKAVIDELFEAKSHIDSVKLSYIAEVANIKRIGGDSDERS